MLRRLPLVLAGVLPLLLVVACGALQGSPNFRETYGGVDEPCAPSKVVSHCTAHVFLVNNGGDGVGYATLAVPLANATATASSARTSAASSARITSMARCPVDIPNTPSGSTVDLTCNFDLPAGKTVASVPVVQDLAFTAPEPSNASAGDTTGVATIGLAVVAAALALITLAGPILRRRRLVASAAQSSDSHDQREAAPADEGDDNSW